jgi:hypothetical protein
MLKLNYVSVQDTHCWEPSPKIKSFFVKWSLMLRSTPRSRVAGHCQRPNTISAFTCRNMAVKVSKWPVHWTGYLETLTATFRHRQPYVLKFHQYWMGQWNSSDTRSRACIRARVLVFPLAAISLQGPPHPPNKTKSALFRPLHIHIFLHRKWTLKKEKVPVWHQVMTKQEKEKVPRTSTFWIVEWTCISFTG